jgi:lysine-specific demethylase/histidyl-hydroxylase NO66
MPDAAVRDTSDTLTRVLGDTSRFTTEVFGQRPDHRPAADPDGFADVLDLAAADHLVASSGLRAPAFRLVRQGETLPQAAVTRRARIGGRQVDDLIDVAAVHRAFAAGATIVLQGLHRSWPPLLGLCRELEDLLHHPVQANAYLTPPVAQGLDLHADPHDVLVLHTHGTKRWVVEPAEGRALDLTLAPGDVLYLPAGTRHAAQTTDSTSLHLTIGVRTTTWRDLLDRAVQDVLAAHGDGDRPLPAGWTSSPAELVGELRRRLSEVAAHLDDAEVTAAAVDAGVRSWQRTRRPDDRGRLLDLAAAATVADDTPLARRPGTAGVLTTDGDEAVLVLHDRRLRMPGFVAPAVRAVLEVERCTPSDLGAHLDPDSRLVLCRRLVREGLLTIERPGGG